MFYTTPKIRIILPSVITAKLLFTLLRRFAANHDSLVPDLYWVYFATLKQLRNTGGIHGGRTVLRGYRALEMNG